jgi:hypothetical protein
MKVHEYWTWSASRILGEGRRAERAVEPRLDRWFGIDCNYRDYRAFLRGADFIVATPTCCENEDVCGGGLGFSAFGFLFSRLPLCSRFAMAGLLGGRVSAVTPVSIFIFTDNGYSWEGGRTFFSMLATRLPVERWGELWRSG